MSDANRQSFTDKASSAMKPDSQKGMAEQVGDSAKSAYDSVASTVQPEASLDTASATQKAGDAFSGNSNQNDQSILDKAKDAFGMGGNTGSGNRN
ncbi:heat shock protein 9/12-domain-containing protein [Rhodocollybia butyracea]|uniref:Heat shock protein 9/12-domain-containing protein n=1 Tax=Rhodocollybia butyracea TaxID=206335 RepID=A0A9P5UEC8_9AGAR|nr:heat shock protein 9/12-domain-containing protein [Rhodocollybia butyracea]